MEKMHPQQAIEDRLIRELRNGWEIIHRGEHEILLRRRRPTNHGLHALLSLLTFGLSGQRSPRTITGTSTTGCRCGRTGHWRTTIRPRSGRRSPISFAFGRGTTCERYGGSGTTLTRGEQLPVG